MGDNAEQTIGPGHGPVFRVSAIKGVATYDRLGSIRPR